MSVEFEEELISRTQPQTSSPDAQNAQTPNVQFAESAPVKGGMIGWLLRKGIVKTEDQATYVLIALVVVVILASVYIAFGDTVTAKFKKPQVIYLEDLSPDFRSIVSPDVLKNIPSRSK